MSRPPLAEIPTRPVPVPPAVRSLVDSAGGGDLVAVWENSLGGLTFRWGADRYVKWVAAGTPEIDLLAEAERLAWASRFTAVPRVLDAGQDEFGAWLVTEAIDAASAVDPRWIAEPATAAAAIGRGLRVLHDALPVEDCPFTWSVEQRVVRADERIAAGEGPSEWFPEHSRLTVAEARPLLDLTPPVDRLVVCHGDACAPNTLLSADGSFAAHVDLGSLGVADRWADLAVAAWSTEWNYGPGYDGIVYEAYGIEPDTERITYYRLLWDLG
ncbi:aminoglycoside 3'-phosphotransferase [Oerskovia rustica]|uniref:Aminoglycoside 3'-phosphotransferase n=1 Tax=Oerskovia rustica TaxID=2762237 RepID=A0ABR8RXV6_9CELL|nr:aminoglycoside 3'-phosphotransferase [Oerskovia rustica]MBD7952207.1 aminoglycoside 3'-phosphotransferase [Oerskovia rustica]